MQTTTYLLCFNKKTAEESEGDTLVDGNNIVFHLGQTVKQNWYTMNENYKRWPFPATGPLRLLPQHMQVF
jgi:hypothetical protein